MTTDDRRIAAALADEVARLTARSLGEAAAGQALHRRGLTDEATRCYQFASAYAEAADVIEAATMPQRRPVVRDVLAEVAAKAPLAAEATTMLRTARATYISAERRDAAAGQLVQLLIGSDGFAEAAPQLRELLAETSMTLRSVGDVAVALEGIGCLDEAATVRLATTPPGDRSEAAATLRRARDGVLAASWSGGAAQAEAERCVADLERLASRCDVVVALTSGS